MIPGDYVRPTRQRVERLLRSCRPGGRFRIGDVVSGETGAVTTNTFPRPRYLKAHLSYSLNPGGLRSSSAKKPFGCTQRSAPLASSHGGVQELEQSRSCRCRGQRCCPQRLHCDGWRSRRPDGRSDCQSRPHHLTSDGQLTGGAVRVRRVLAAEDSDRTSIGQLASGVDARLPEQRSNQSTRVGSRLADSGTVRSVPEPHQQGGSVPHDLDSSSESAARP